MKNTIIVLALLLSACSTVPVVTPMPKWPDVPEDLKQPAPALIPLNHEQRQLSDLIENSNENYTQYYLLKERYEAWQNWYENQKKIWNGLQ
jgi:hypothetical protein